MRPAASRLSRVSIALMVAWILALAPAGALAQAGTTAALTAWLFDNYMEQQIDAAAKRAVSRDPALAAAILKSRAALAGSLARHRGVFESTIAPAIDANFKAQELPGLDKALREINAGREAGLTDAQRQGLAALDEDFRRNGQSVIRAVAIDVEALVLEISKQIAPR